MLDFFLSILLGPFYIARYKYIFVDWARPVTLKRNKLNQMHSFWLEKLCFVSVALEEESIGLIIKVGMWLGNVKDFFPLPAFCWLHYKCWPVFGLIYRPVFIC